MVEDFIFDVYEFIYSRVHSITLQENKERILNLKNIRVTVISVIARDMVLKCLD